MNKILNNNGKFITNAGKIVTTGNTSTLNNTFWRMNAVPDISYDKTFSFGTGESQDDAWNTCKYID